MKKVANEMIPLIEKALGFKLRGWQIAFLLGKLRNMPNERGSGRTTVSIVKFLLTNEEPFDIKRDALKFKDHHGFHYSSYFKNEMQSIDDKLTAVGLSTCSVKPKRIRGITIDLGVDTNKLQLKLRAIAKHTEALANELDSIDNAWQCEYCGHDEYVVHEIVHLRVQRIHKYCKCAKCNEKCVIVVDEDLPRPEGSD